jgi:MAF protein
LYHRGDGRHRIPIPKFSTVGGDQSIDEGYVRIPAVNTEDERLSQKPDDKLPFALASSSPRRRELIDLFGRPVKTLKVDVDEQPFKGENPTALAQRLATAKLQLAASEQQPESIMIAADTVVADDTRLLGKPANQAAALEMLMSLRGHSHDVITVVAIRVTTEQSEWIESCTTKVPMRDYSKQEVESYVRSGSPLDKAGAYGIQDESHQMTDLPALTGCFANVMGLPLCHLARGMARLGQPPSVDIAARCIEHTGYPCTVYPAILEGSA